MDLGQALFDVVEFELVLALDFVDAVAKLGDLVFEGLALPVVLLGLGF